MKKLLIVTVAGASAVGVLLVTATSAQANPERSRALVTIQVVDNSNPPRRPAPAVHSSVPDRPDLDRRVSNRPNPARPEPARPEPPRPEPPEPDRPDPNRLPVPRR